MIGRLIQAAGIIVSALGLWLAWPIIVPIFIGDPPMIHWIVVDHLAALANFFRYLLLMAVLAPAIALFYLGASMRHQSMRGS
jgi:hypothetical protein